MKQKGFTLIELLVTMGIIAVLTGLSIFNFNQSRVRARDVQRKSDLGQLMKALELYKNDKNKYPSDPLTFQTDLLNNGQIKKIFNDPKGAIDWRAYQYVPEGSPNTTDYYLMACLENAADTTKATGSVCDKFIISSGCMCGPDSDPGNRPGVMYIVSNQ